MIIQSDCIHLDEENEVSTYLPTCPMYIKSKNSKKNFYNGQFWIFTLFMLPYKLYLY